MVIRVLVRGITVIKLSCGGRRLVVMLVVVLVLLMWHSGWVRSEDELDLGSDEISLMRKVDATELRLQLLNDAVKG